MTAGAQKETPQKLSTQLFTGEQLSYTNQSLSHSVLHGGGEKPGLRVAWMQIPVYTCKSFIQLCTLN